MRNTGDANGGDTENYPLERRPYHFGHVSLKLIIGNGIEVMKDNGVAAK